MWMELEDGRKIEIRRLYCELVIQRREYTLKEIALKCNEYCKEQGLKISFAPGCVGQFIRCETDFSLKKLEVFCDVLGWRRDIRELSERFIMPPKTARGFGKAIQGERGTIIHDYNGDK